MTNPLIDLETARALVARGWSVVPTASDMEKRPQGNFATAKSWRDFSDRLPTDAELLGWFGPKPRRGGVVLHKGQLCVDRDTKDSLPDGSAPWEETDHGSHEFFQCTAETKPSHDHDAKIDYLTYGSFVRFANPQCLLDWEGDLPRWETSAAETAVTPAVETAAVPLSGGTIRDTLIAQGWKPIGIHGNREDFSRPGAAHPTRCDASLFDGSSFKVWSTAAMAPKPAATVEPPPVPVVKSVAELAAEDPQLSEPVVNFCRRGSFALVSGDPKAGKTTLALKICAKKATEGFRCLYADFENGPALFWHRLKKVSNSTQDGLHYLDCRFSPTIDCIAAAMREIGEVDLLVIDCWGLLIAGDGVEDESSNALVSQYFLRVRRTLGEFNAATIILHHTPKSGANEKLCFAGAGASSLQRYVQTIARISQDKSGAYWFNALCREFDDPFTPVLLRAAPSSRP